MEPLNQKLSLLISRKLLAALETGTRRSMKGSLEIFLFLACKKYGMPLALQQE
jgi:hypothetical protein